MAKRNRRVSIFVTLLNGAFTVTRMALDFIGYSTAAEDTAGLLKKLKPVLDWIAAQPWYLGYGVPIAIGAVAAYFWFRPERGSDAESAHTVISHSQQGGITAHTVNTGQADGGRQKEKD